MSSCSLRLLAPRLLAQSLFAAPAPQAVRLLAPSVDEATVRAPESRKREQALTLWETPLQTPVVKRRICGKRPDAAGIYAGMKSSPVVEPCLQLEQHEFMRQSGRGQYLAFMYRLRRWVAIVEAKAAPEGISQYILQCRDASFQVLSPSAKAELVRGFLDATAAPDWLREWAVERWHLHRCGKSPQLHSKTVLLTYQGDFGLVPVENYLPLACVGATCFQLRAGPTVRQL